MQETFLIADLHLGHKNVIQYDNRSFISLQDMDETIIKNWNKVIKKEYVVFVLGDVSFYPKNKTKEIIEQLNGRKYLIMGNHDKGHSVRYWKDVGFEEVSKHPLIFNDEYILSHEPIYKIDGKDLFYNIHGHLASHGSLYNDKVFYSVSMHRGIYTPINFKKIVEYFENVNK